MNECAWCWEEIEDEEFMVKDEWGNYFHDETCHENYVARAESEAEVEEG